MHAHRVRSLAVVRLMLNDFWEHRAWLRGLPRLLGEMANGGMENLHPVWWPGDGAWFVLLYGGVPVRP
jgi:hypothetical protein